MLVVFCSSHSAGRLLFCEHMEAKDLALQTSLLFLPPPSGSFATLRFISVHGVHGVYLHTYTISRSPMTLQIPVFFCVYLKE
jgi:hypothetical protein